MTHEDAGHYALKHPLSAIPDERIVEAVRPKVLDGKITCAAVHKIATDLNVPPSEVGRTLDLLEIRFTKCQLGLYGYGEQYRIVKPAETVAPALREAIEAAVVDNRVPCLAAWKIADKFGLKKLDVANACEALKIKVGKCQIGSFK